MFIYKCSKCGQESVPGEDFDSNRFHICSSCGSREYTEVFPAIRNEIQKGERPETALGEEATCFNHPNNVAVATCESCGMYLCKLCDLEIEGSHLCPDCLASGRKKLKTALQKTFLYDELALHLTILPILFIYAFVVTAPVALIISIVCWHKVKTPYKRNKWRFVVAFILGLAEVFAIAGIFIALAKGVFLK
jgi:hypothetical protein